MNDIIRGALPPDVARPLAAHLRDLREIAPDAYLQYNSALRCWEVMKDLIIADQDEHGVVRKATLPVIRAVFEDFNQRAIDNLRYRRWVGLNFNKNRETYTRWLLEEHKQSKAIEKDRAADMLTRGLMAWWKTSRQKTYVMGGSHGSVLRVDGKSGLRSE